MANAAITIKGLEDIYRYECSAIEQATQRTIEETTLLQAQFTHSLSKQFHLLDERVAAAYKRSILNSILASGQGVAIDIERSIEKDIAGEIERLAPFITSVDRIYQYFASPPNSTHRSPLFERLNVYQTSYLIGDSEGIDGGGIKARSIYNVGAITAFLEVSPLFEFFEKLNFETEYKAIDVQGFKSALITDIVEKTQSLVGERSSDKAQDLKKFVRARFGELRNEIEMGFAEIRKLLSVGGAG